MIPWTLHSQCDSVNTFCYCGLRVPMMDWKWNASNTKYVIQQILSMIIVVLHWSFLQSFQIVWKQFFMGYVCIDISGESRLSSAWTSCIGCHLKGTLQITAKWSSAEFLLWSGSLLGISLLCAKTKGWKQGSMWCLCVNLCGLERS